MSFANDLLIENPPRGNGWKKLFALTLVLMAAALVGAAQTITTLHSFTFDDGANPNLVTPTQGGDGNIYATTSIGGSKTVKCFCGTTFKMTPQGALTSVSFDGADGAIPDAGFLLGRNGLLYGTTSSGGASGNGEVFRLNSQTGVLTVLHSFAGSDGASPDAPLTLGPGGKYYGTTAFGGANSFGTVFSITPSGTFKSLHSFSGAGEGQNPSAGLTLGSDGALYRVTCGTIVKSTDRTLTTLYSFPSFDHVDGAKPFGLMQHTDGKFYGTTSEGGTSINCDSFDSIGCGTVFSLDLGLGPFVTFVVPSGKVGSVIQILGTDLTGTTAVSFNGVPAPSFKVVRDTFIKATLPAGPPTSPVTVTNSTGTLTSNVNFTVMP